MLRGVTDKSNGKNLFINERIPESDKWVHTYANREKQLRTVTDNCTVKLEMQRNSGRGSRYIEVRSRTMKAPKRS